MEFIDYKKDESENWILKSKSEITYSGESVTRIGSEYNSESENWELSFKNEYIIQNGLNTKRSYYFYKNGAWVKNTERTYQFSGTKITAWQSSYDRDLDGTFELNYKGEYIYQDGKLSESTSYKLDETNNWYQFEKRTFTYSGNLITGWNSYRLRDSSNWKDYEKSEYKYLGDKVSQIQNFFSSESQWEFTFLESFTYDSNGCLNEYLYGDFFKETYEYEEGIGNAKLFYYNPSLLVYGEPTIKNATNSISKNFISNY